tara:strand:+ start:2222 stop:2548 length:327 start_codon:yes stop_codon:yes gene_type:complete
MGAIKLIIENTMYYSDWITRKNTKTVKKGGTPWFQPLTTQVWNANKPRLFRLLKEQIDITEAEIKQSSLSRDPFVSGIIPPPTLLRPQTRTQRTSAMENLIKLVRQVA